MCEMCDARMRLQEFGCNFPDCAVYPQQLERDYNKDSRIEMAILHNGSILVFCQQHRTKLAAEGVKLVGFANIYEELDSRFVRRMIKKTRQSQKAFIKSLKK